MKRTWLLAAVLALCGLTLSVPAEAQVKVKPDLPKMHAHGKYVHVVVFTMKKDAPKDATATAIADCHTMLSKIKAVRHVKAGRPAAEATPKLAKKGYDFALVVLVDDAAGLKSYLDDPLHLAFVEKHGKHFDMDRLLVFDFIDAKK